MRRILVTVLALSFALTLAAHAQSGPYKIIAQPKVGGDGGFDYVFADAAGRKLYIPRSGPTGRITVYSLDTLAPLGETPGSNAHGVAVDTASGHGFASSNPVLMFDTTTIKAIKTIAVTGSPDGILGDPATGHIYILSHRAPNVTVINAKDGSIVGTIDLGGAPEQAQLDGKGHLYIDLEDKGSIAVVDTAKLSLITTLSLAGKGDGCAGLALDASNGILFAACRTPQVFVILHTDGTIITTLPIGRGVDGAAFNPATGEAFATAGDSTLTVVKESSPTSFAVEQVVTTPAGARTITLDAKTGHIFTMTSLYGPAPTPAPGATPSPFTRRGPMIPGSFSIIEIGK